MNTRSRLREVLGGTGLYSIAMRVFRGRTAASIAVELGVTVAEIDRRIEQATRIYGEPLPVREDRPLYENDGHHTESPAERKLRSLKRCSHCHLLGCSPELETCVGGIDRFAANRRNTE